MSCSIFFAEMLAPLNDGHVSYSPNRHGREKDASRRRKRRDSGRNSPAGAIEQLFETTGKTLVANGFGQPKGPRHGCFTTAGRRMLGTCGSLSWKVLKTRTADGALDKIGRDFKDLTAASLISATARAETTTPRSRSSIGFATAGVLPFTARPRPARRRRSYADKDLAHRTGR